MIFCAPWAPSFVVSYFVSRLCDSRELPNPWVCSQCGLSFVCVSFFISIIHLRPSERGPYLRRAQYDTQRVPPSSSLPFRSYRSGILPHSSISTTAEHTSRSIHSTKVDVSLRRLRRSADVLTVKHSGGGEKREWERKRGKRRWRQEGGKGKWCCTTDTLSSYVPLNAQMDARRVDAVIVPDISSSHSSFVLYFNFPSSFAFWLQMDFSKILIFFHTNFVISHTSATSLSYVNYLVYFFLSCTRCISYNFINL